MKDTHNERMRAVLMRLIEGFSSYFVSCLENTYHQTPENVNVQNISVEKKLGTTGIHIVQVQLDSDLGPDEASIAVKIYDEKEQALDVVKRINFLERRLSECSSLGISSPAVIFFSGSVVIMEGIQGDVFRESRVPKPQKYRYAGRSLAVFHGLKPDKVWFDKYKLLISKSLENLPVSLEIRKNLYSLFSETVPLAEQTSKLSGSISFGDFHPGNIIFDVKIGRNPMIQTHLIDPEYLTTSTENDRLEDICNFFAVEAVDQFRIDPELRNFRMNIKSFLSGYQEILAINQSSFDNFYSTSYTPVNFHLALMILMSILNILDMADLFGGEKGIEKEILLRCELIEKMLRWKNFPD
ncbi:MAG: hypothetical protein ACFFAJ_01475 [Candidatus Hodarchaeota archaeon]